MLEFVVVFDLGRCRRKAPALLLPLQIDDVVLSAAFRVAEDEIRLVERAKPLFVAGLLVVRVIPLGQQPLDAVNCFGFGSLDDMQQLVVIGILRHFG